MAGSAVPSLIFFVGSIVVATAFVGMVNNSVPPSSMISGDELARELRSSFEVIHVNASSNIQVYASNIGGASYGLAEVRAMVDGEWLSGTIGVVKGDSDSLWEPGEVIRITNASNNLALGWHEARVLVQGRVWSPGYSFSFTG